MQCLTVIRNTAESAVSCRKTCEWLITETLFFFCPLLFCARNPSLRGEKSPWSQSSAAWWHVTPSLSHPSSSWTWSVEMMKWTHRRRCHWSNSQRVSCTMSSAFLAGWWKMAGIKVGSTVWCSLVVLCWVSALLLVITWGWGQKQGVRAAIIYCSDIRNVQGNDDFLPPVNYLWANSF